MKYLIGTGYHATAETAGEKASFANYWWENLHRYAPTSKVVMLCVNGALPPVISSPYIPGVICLSNNLGHIGQLLSGEKKYDYCGWSAGMLALALIAYNNEQDFLYREQDCLAFGPWVEQMYTDLGDGNVVFGSCKLMGVAQSLFLVKHAYIPKFVRLYLGLGTDNNTQMLPEHKFHTLERMFPKDWKRLSFGYDRDRPFNVTDPVWYVQQLTVEELEQIREAGLI